PGKTRLIAQIERQAVRNQADLNSPHPYLTLTSASGPDDIWFLNGYDAYADVEQVASQMAAMQDLMAALPTAAERKAALWINPRSVFARLREDLSYGRGLTGAHTRFFLVSTVQVRRGHGAEFTELRRIVRGGHERARAADNLSVYEVESGMPDGTFLIFSPA